MGLLFCTVADFVASHDNAAVLSLILIVLVLAWLGLIDKKHVTIRPGVRKVAFFSLGGLTLFILLVVSLDYFSH